VKRQKLFIYALSGLFAAAAGIVLASRLSSAQPQAAQGEAVEAGTLYASVGQQPAELGRIAVRNAVRAAEGEKVAKWVMVPVKVVTSENVAEFSG
jgi:ABC-type xylose transport system permease subunit